MNRKLIRPDLRGSRDRPQSALTNQQLQRRRSVPPDETGAESNYYLKQMAARTRMVVLLRDGEELRGTIEWYDHEALKLHREGAPNLLLMKRSIKYMYKEDDARYREDERSDE